MVETIEEERKGHFAKFEGTAWDEACRIYLKKVRTLNMGGCTSISEFEILKAEGADIFGISELNKNWEHPIIFKRYERVILKSYRGADVHVANNDGYQPKGFQNQGVIMMVTSHYFQGQVEKEKVIHYKYGRRSKPDVRRYK